MIYYWDENQNNFISIDGQSNPTIQVLLLEQHLSWIILAAPLKQKLN